jgi:hypothetical protein
MIRSKALTVDSVALNLMLDIVAFLILGKLFNLTESHFLIHR